MPVTRIFAVAVGAVATIALAAPPASAHECFNTQKSPGSGGYWATYDVASDTFTPNPDAKGNPTFIRVVFPDGSEVYGFSHSGFEGVVGGAKDCDGKGLDNAEECFGG